MAAASPVRYDKFSYAVKRKPERDTASPSGTPKGASLNKSAAGTGLQPLALTRDGFAIAEDGSLMSRVVSPPRWTPGNSGAVVYASAPMNASAASPMNMSFGSPVAATPIRGGVAAPPCSPATTVKGSAKKSHADPWGALVAAAAGKLSEDDLVMLSWDTVADLLEHFGISNPVDIGKVQLTWRRKQDLALGQDVFSDVATRGETDAGSLSGAAPRGMPEMEDSLADPPRYAGAAGRSPGESVLVYASPNARALEQQPIMQIAYGRPSSPRHGGGPRFTPDHKKPLKWTAEPKIDTGRKGSFRRSGSFKAE